MFHIPKNTLHTNLTISNPKLRMLINTELTPELWHLDVACFFIMALEIIVRFLTCPQMYKFFQSIYNIVDLMCILPVTITVILHNVHPTFWADKSLKGLAFFLSIFGVFKILRLVKLARHNHAMSILLLALKASLRELLLLVMLMGMGILVFAYLIYFAEFNNTDGFETIPVGFWWAIVTMTTVGYGDRVPITEWGYVVGTMCAMCGMLSTGLAIPIIANNFNTMYMYARDLMIQKKRKTTQANTNKIFAEKESVPSVELHCQGASSGSELSCSGTSMGLGTVRGVQQEHETTPFRMSDGTRQHDMHISTLQVAQPENIKLQQSRFESESKHFL